MQYSMVRQQYDSGGRRSGSVRAAVQRTPATVGTQVVAVGDTVQRGGVHGAVGLVTSVQLDQYGKWCCTVESTDVRCSGTRVWPVSGVAVLQTTPQYKQQYDGSWTKV